MPGLMRMGAALALTTFMLASPAFAGPARTLRVRFAPQVPASQVHDALSVSGVITVGHPAADTYVVQGARRQTAEQLATLFAAMPGVAVTDPVAPIALDDSYQPAYFQDQAINPGELDLSPLPGSKLDQAALAQALGATRVAIDPQTGAARVMLPPGTDLSVARQLAANQPGVAAATPRRSLPVPDAAAKLAGSGRIVGAMPLTARDVAVTFHPGTAEVLQRRFQAVFAAATVRRTGRWSLIVRPPAAAATAARAYRLVPMVRQAEPHYGS